MACLQGLGRFRHVIRSGHSRRRNRRWQGFALFEADIAIKDGKIAEIGSVSGAELCPSPLKLGHYFGMERGFVMARTRHSDEDILKLLREIEVKLSAGSNVQ